MLIFLLIFQSLRSRPSLTSSLYLSMLLLAKVLTLSVTLLALNQCELLGQKITRRSVLEETTQLRVWETLPI